QHYMALKLSADLSTSSPASLIKHQHYPSISTPPPGWNTTQISPAGSVQATMCNRSLASTITTTQIPSTTTRTTLPMSLSRIASRYSTHGTSKTTNGMCSASRHVISMKTDMAVKCSGRKSIVVVIKSMGKASIRIAGNYSVAGDYLLQKT